MITQKRIYELLAKVYGIIKYCVGEERVLKELVMDYLVDAGEKPESIDILITAGYLIDEEDGYVKLNIHQSLIEELERIIDEKYLWPEEYRNFVFAYLFEKMKEPRRCSYCGGAAEFKLYAADGTIFYRCQSCFYKLINHGILLIHKDLWEKGLKHKFHNMLLNLKPKIMETEYGEATFTDDNGINRKVKIIRVRDGVTLYECRCGYRFASLNDLRCHWNVCNKV